MTNRTRLASRVCAVALVAILTLANPLPVVVADDTGTGPTAYTTSPPANATAPPNDPPIPMKESDAWPTNLLTIDGASGLVTSATFIGANLTDVTVTKVKPETTGFRLKDHNGQYVWLDQISTSKGMVEFWHVPVIAGGAYTVIQAVNGVESTILTFLAGVEAPQGSAQCADSSYQWYDCESRHGSAQTGGGSNSGSQNPNPSGGGGPETCAPPWTHYYKTSKVLWTPLVIAHAPHAGSGTANGQWTKTEAWFAAQFGVTSYTEENVRLDTHDGMTKGVFKLLKWGWYDVYRGDGCSMTYVGTTMKILEDLKQSHTFVLWGASLDTDGDDLTSVGYAGYGSLYFDTRYHGSDRTISAETEGTTYGKSGSTLFQIGASIPGWTYFNNIGAQASDASGTLYTYSIPASSFKVDYLQDGEQGWAFCEPRWATC